jgi:hypothetical protein
MQYLRWKLKGYLKTIFGGMLRWASIPSVRQRLSAKNSNEK